jgi:hypothetical protein
LHLPLDNGFAPLNLQEAPKGDVEAKEQETQMQQLSHNADRINAIHMDTWVIQHQ